MYRYNSKAAANWIGLGLEAWSLYLESVTVVYLRTMKLAIGGFSAEPEARLMVTEKLLAVVELSVAASTGNLGRSPTEATRKVLGHYGQKVRANRRRLS